MKNLCLTWVLVTQHLLTNSGVHYRQYRKSWKLEINTADLLHLGGNGSEPCAFSYSSGSLAAGTSWMPDVSVVQDVDEELDSSPTTSVRDTETIRS